MESWKYRPTLEPLEDRYLLSALSALIAKLTHPHSQGNPHPPVSPGLVQTGGIPVPTPKALPAPANRFVNGFNPFPNGLGIPTTVPPTTTTTGSTGNGGTSSGQGNGGVIVILPPTTPGGMPTAQNLFGGLPASSTPGSGAFAVFPPGSSNPGAVAPLLPFGGQTTTGSTLPSGPALSPFPNTPAVTNSGNLGPALSPFPNLPAENSGQVPPQFKFP
jgi:hypothetical protein